MPTPHKSLQLGDELTDDESGYDSNIDDNDFDCTISVDH